VGTLQSYSLTGGGVASVDDADVVCIDVETPGAIDVLEADAEVLALGPAVAEAAVERTVDRTVDGTVGSRRTRRAQTAGLATVQLANH